MKDNVSKPIDSIDRISQGIQYLKADCSKVLFIEIVNKCEIPNHAVKEDCDDVNFDHEFNTLTTDYWDVCDFYGHIYLPLDE